MNISTPPPTPPIPELGPRIVFFTGGTALRNLSQSLKGLTHNSVHLVTPFDSGGSSARLRRVFAMPAVGDIRNRMLALADTDIVPKAVLDILQMRLPNDGDRLQLLQQLYDLASEKNAIWQGIPRTFSEVLRVHLCYFLEKMPENFDPYHASIGNLLITGGYLHHGKNLEPVLAFMSRLLQVKGTVLPIVNESLHLAAELENGDIVVGQHHITGKGATTLPAPVKRIFLSVHEALERHPEQNPCSPRIATQAATHIRTADLICYPMGSFYSSVLANLLPTGAGRAVAQATCPKCYIPNTGADPEQAHLSVADAVQIILKILRNDMPDAPTKNLLNAVLIDTRNGFYPRGIDIEAIRAQGIDIIDTHLIQDSEHHDAAATAQALVDYATAQNPAI